MLIVLVVCFMLVMINFTSRSNSNSSGSRKIAHNKSRIRFIDTLSEEEKSNVLTPSKNVKNDEFFTIDENPDQVKIDLKVLARENLQFYKKELRKFQSKYSYLQYGEASILKYFKQHPPDYMDPDSRLIDKQRQTLYTNIFELILSNAPTGVQPLKKYQSKLSKIKDYAMQLYYERFLTEPTLDQSFLEKHGLIIDEKDKRILKLKHSSFLYKLGEIKASDLKFGQKNANGIVYVGGGKFTFLALLSIISLRESGSNLPVEVLIPNNVEHEPEFCDVHFPKLNARCILLSQIISPEITKKIALGGYQYKSLLLMVSSFENVLLLDSDCFVIRNPDDIFNTEPFTTQGMVVWPDYWRRVTHPAYYDIANLEISDSRSRYGIDKYTFTEQELKKSWFGHKAKNSVPLHDRKNTIPDPSSETGQLLINKKTHFNTILLSLYYNYYGPDYYYPLFSQGTQGEGDKETFILLANALGQEFYQVNKRVEACGYWEKETFTGTGMFQFDPVTDYLNLQNYLSRKSTDITKYDPMRFPKVFTKENSKMLFLHNNYPKIDPYRLILDGNLIEKNLENKITKMIRLFGPVDMDNIGKDLELVIWKYVSFYLCDMKVYVRAWDIDLFNTNMNRNDVCHFIQRHLEFLNKYDQNAVFSSN